MYYKLISYFFGMKESDNSEQVIYKIPKIHNDWKL